MSSQLSWSIIKQFSSRKVFGSTFQDVARKFQDVARKSQEENYVRIGKGSGSFGYTISATALSIDL